MTNADVLNSPIPGSGNPKEGNRTESPEYRRAYVGAAAAARVEEALRRVYPELLAAYQQEANNLPAQFAETQNPAQAESARVANQQGAANFIQQTIQNQRPEWN